MNSKLRQYLQEELDKNPRFANQARVVLQGGNWTYCNDGLDVDSATAGKLNSRPTSKWFEKFDSPWQAIFWIPKTDIAVVLNLSSKPRETTLDSRYKELLACVPAAIKSFDANHDELTGIFNRHGIKWLFERNYSNFAGKTLEAEVVDQQFPSLNQILPNLGQIAIIAFDIDKFKTVNDTYGHDAGDAVLVMFASRLTKIIINLEKAYDAKFIFGRPGGEEFEISIFGQLTKVNLDKISNVLLAGINEPSFPSEAEIKAYVKSRPKAKTLVVGIDLPHRVTASIGIVFERIVENSKPWDEVYKDLGKSADLALYRAKKDGRNCVRFYDDIRLIHGRISEFYPDSDLAIIDIGRAVGVSRGDAYRVFFPPFIGEKIIDGEASTKVLGNYPNVESGRLLVLETQEQVSTCLVLERNNNIPFPKGALLHFGYFGSKPFLISRPRQRQVGLGLNDDHLGKYIQSLLDTNSLHSVIRLGLSASEDDQRDRETILEELISVIHLNSPPFTRIFGGNGFGLYIVLKNQADVDVQSKKAVVVLLLDSIKKGERSCSAGIFIPELLSTLEVTVTPESILFYCSAAYTATKTTTEKYTFFQKKTPSGTINTWRRKHLAEQAIADYQQFCQYGFKSASIDNQFGLAIMASELEHFFPLAEIAFSKAVAINPNVNAYQANLGLICAKLGNYNKAFEILKKVESYVKADKELGTYNSYLLAYAKSAIEVDKIVPFESNFIEGIVALAIAHNDALKNSFTYQSWAKEIYKVHASGFLKKVEA